MPAGLVNQLMSCYWLEAGYEIECLEESEQRNGDAMKKLEDLRKRRKTIKFDF